MFGLFKKKVTSYPTESTWSVFEGKNQGKPMIGRRNESAASLSGSTDYSFRVGVAVPLHTPDEHGLPGSEESSELSTIEDSVCAGLEANQLSLLVLVLTTSGMREFVLYTQNADDARTTVETLISQTKSHQLQFYIAKDSKWSLYRQFT